MVFFLSNLLLSPISPILATNLFHNNNGIFGTLIICDLFELHVKFIYSPLSPYSDTGNMYIYEFIQTCLLLLILEHTRVHFSLLMRMYGSSKTVEGTTFPLNSLWRWERERTGFFVSKRCHYSRNRHWHLDLYPPALGTIPFGYWASRVLGPSSKARDGAGLYT